jgi:hypothetical protein
MDGICNGTKWSNVGMVYWDYNKLCLPKVLSLFDIEMTWWH